jgi:carbon-monoxide dehydrogenase large subunit
LERERIVTKSGAKKSQRGWVGAAVPCGEHLRFVQGAGRYTDDLFGPEMLHMAMLRSPYGHATLKGIDLSKALSHPGVLDAVAHGDLAGRVGDLPMLWVIPGMRCGSFPVLARGKVRYAGEPVAAVVAVDRYVAEDALDAIAADYDVLPAVTDALDAVTADAPLLYEDWGENVAYRHAFHNGNIEEAFAAADVVVHEEVYHARNHPLPMETRACVAKYNSMTGDLMVWSSTQVPHRLKSVIAACLEIPEHRVQVVCPDVGGAFGAKLHFYPEEILVGFFAMRTGRTVRWCEDRLEHLRATNHAREQYLKIDLAARRDGTLLGVKADVTVDCGAHPYSRGVGPSFVTIITVPGPYKIGAYEVSLTGVVTNKTPFGAYRGFGKPQAVLLMERAMDRLAQSLAMDPAALRLKNLVRPEDMPYPSATGRGKLSAGDYPGCLVKAMNMMNWSRKREEHQTRRRERVLRGLGIANFVEVTGMPSANLGKSGRMHSGSEAAIVRVEPDGSVLVASSYTSSGQGQETTFAQLAASELGLELERVRVILGDTRQCPYSSYGAAASRGAVAGGGAVVLAAKQVAAQLRNVAAHMLGAKPNRMKLASGAVAAPDGRSVPLAEVANAVYLAHDLPENQAPGILESRVSFDVPETVFAYAAHIAEVELDRETGNVNILDYVVVDDCGTVINPMVVDGQIAGGVAQGIGGALYEQLIYDENGQLLTGSLMDYLAPTACEVPRVRIEHHPTPMPGVPLGMKGVGEQGVVGAPAALANAVADALGVDPGVYLGRLPLTPERVLELIKLAEKVKGTLCTT